MRFVARAASAGIGCLLAGVLAWSGATTASASHPQTRSAAPKRKLRQAEIRTLGPRHAAEHAIARAATRRAAKRWRAMSSKQRKRYRARQRAIDRSLAARTAGREGTLGAWTTAPFALPVTAIHAGMLPTGKMLFWSYPFTPNPEMDRNEGRAALWDPSKGTGPAAFKTVTPPLIDVDADGTLEPAPIFCSGQSFLPNGALLVAGGTMSWPDGTNQFLGSNIMHTFDPWSEQWITQPRLRRGRWYPSQVLLADGRTALLGGSTETPPGQSEGNTDLEIFTAPTSPSGVGSVAHFPSGDRFVDQYPHLFTLPNGNVLLAGPDRDDSAILTTAGFTWTNLGSASRHRIRGSAVLRPGGRTGPASSPRSAATTTAAISPPSRVRRRSTPAPRERTGSPTAPSMSPEPTRTPSCYPTDRW